MKHKIGLVFLLFGACLTGFVLLISAQSQQLKTSTAYEIDWYLTPAEYPCLAETIHLTGTYIEDIHVVVNPSGGYSSQLKQVGAGLKGITAVGMSTGAEYLFRGPLTWIENGTNDEPWVTWHPLEWTFTLFNHFIGPQNFCMRTKWHVTLDRETGEVKTEVLKEDVICR